MDDSTTEARIIDGTTNGGDAIESRYAGFCMVCFL